jgi:hypothetical protein
VIVHCECVVIHEDPDMVESTYYTVFGVVEFEKVSKPTRLLSRIIARAGDTVDSEVFKVNRPFSLYQWFNITSYTGHSLKSHSECTGDALKCFLFQLCRPNSKWAKFACVAALSKAGRKEGASARLAVRAAPYYSTEHCASYSARNGRYSEAKTGSPGIGRLSLSNNYEQSIKKTIHSDIERNALTALSVLYKDLPHFQAW